MVCVFKYLYCSAQLSMSNMEMRYRNKIINELINHTEVVVVVVVAVVVVVVGVVGWLVTSLISAGPGESRGHESDSVLSMLFV